MYELHKLIANVIYLLFPIICYVIYVVFQRKGYGKERDTILELALYSSIYLVLRVSPKVFGVEPIIFCNIPLLLALMRDKKICALCISYLIIICSFYMQDKSIYLLVMEYTFYFILYSVMKEDKHKPYLFVLIVTITKIIIDTNVYSVLLTLTFYIIALICCAIYQRMNSISALRDTIDEMEKEKNLRKSLFTITHEIKNPLAVCKGYLELCHMNPKEQDKYITIMQSEIERTLVILDDFMDLSKIKIHKEEIDINLLLEDLIESTKFLCENHQVILEETLLDDDIYVSADYNRLKQVLINMVKNSVESSKKDGLIQISSDVVKNKAIITIQDNGTGMDEDTIAKLGNTYFTTKNHGSGIGVSFSKEIIESHQGTIEYESKVNEGTKVTIKLPLLQFS